MKYYFIVKPNSGKGKGLRLWNRIRTCLNRYGAEYELFFTDASGDGAEAAKMLTKDPDSCPGSIYVIGGDDTLNAVLNGLVHMTNVNVGYIPTEPKTGCARSLRLPGDIKSLLKRIRAGGNDSGARIEAVDYGVLTCGNGETVRRFVSSTGIGFNAAVQQRMSRSGSGKGELDINRPLGFASAVIKELFFFRPVKGFILLDGTRRIEFNNILFISVHIHPYEGRYRFANLADPKDGMLEICAVNCRNRFRLIPLLIRSRFGNLNECSRVKTYQCSEARIHLERDCAVHTDGDSFGSKRDMELRCIRQQLNILR